MNAAMDLDADSCPRLADRPTVALGQVHLVLGPTDVISLNAEAYSIAVALDGRTPVRDIGARLADCFGVDVELIEPYVLPAVRHLGAIGLIDGIEAATFAPSPDAEIEAEDSDCGDSEPGPGPVQPVAPLDARADVPAPDT